MNFPENTKILRLPIKRKWFDMILAGEKKEEYREIKAHWISRFIKNHERFSDGFKGVTIEWNDFDYIELVNGYSPASPTLLVELSGITIGRPRPEWCDNWNQPVFILSIGKIANYKP